MLINGIYHTNWQLGVSRTMKMEEKIKWKKVATNMSLIYEMFTPLPQYLGANRPIHSSNYASGSCQSL